MTRITRSSGAYQIVNVSDGKRLVSHHEAKPGLIRFQGETIIEHTLKGGIESWFSMRLPDLSPGRISPDHFRYLWAIAIPLSASDPSEEMRVKMLQGIPNFLGWCRAAFPNMSVDDLSELEQAHHEWQRQQAVLVPPVDGLDYLRVTDAMGESMLFRRDGEVWQRSLEQGIQRICPGDRFPIGWWYHLTGGGAGGSTDGPNHKER